MKKVSENEEAIGSNKTYEAVGTCEAAWANDEQSIAREHTNLTSLED